MKIAITGATGLVGSQLSPFLSTGGHDVVAISRGPAGPRTIHWDVETKQIDAAALEGLDVVVHLAGENLASRWTLEKKRKIRDSRVEGTQFLSEQLAKLQQPPKVLVCASAMGYYGDRGDELLSESSPAGRGFLAGVCKAWEAAADPAREAGIRVVHARFGLILSPRGGALKTMLLPFRLGLGGPIGNGQQYWSWISLDDVVGSLHHLMMHEQLAGPVNVCAPRPVTNREFTKTLGKVLGRPTVLTVPKFAARAALGEMADEMLLSSMRMEPQVLQETGYEFRDVDLELCLRKLLGRK